MSLDKMIDTANELKERIDSFGKYDAEILKKINYKFRLDWNYYSNHMEGGTLTKEETRSVMVGNINVNGKPLKDIMEMKGHDEVIVELLNIGKAENRISEKRMKNIHSSIMFEDDPAKRKSIGNWKEIPNHLINYKGEKIEFTLPGDVSNEVQDLLNTLNAELDKHHSKKSKIHPIILAAQFHIDFVTIHPFYDGNGRMARILTNLILISCGFPPIIVKNKVKDSYYKLLADIQVYGGDADLFYKFIVSGVVDSQLLTMTALEGGEIEESDDLDKEIELFKREVEVREAVGTTKKSNELVYEFYFSWINYFFDLLESKHKKFDSLFAENFYYRYINRSFIQNHNEHDQIATEFANSTDVNKRFRYREDLASYSLEIAHKTYNRKGPDLFSIGQCVNIDFSEYKYTIDDSHGTKIECLYDEIPNETELNSWVNTLVKKYLEILKARTNES